ncbi:serine/threonine-protein kinase VRK1 [Elysia marginata]|uniref:non-specific serine/threonine protein kinase n=1 Tax=Elysia marginata TaxID=1093978 RepID=A0AAV4HH55_9GAST|nr:serine/threonine-protein kinase VRK1 [Elysia marginata]
MPRGVGAVPKKAARAPKAYKLAEEFPAGTVLQDVFKKQWQLSSVIGQGGFGLIYLASEGIGKVDKNTASHVIKIEPKENGPLYCEMQFYQRVAKPNLIQSFVTASKLRYLSVPPYISTGRHMLNSKEFRFLVMPRLGTDLQKYLVQKGGHFDAKTTFAIGLRMLDALQFLHENEYVHADIKAANILTGYRTGVEIENEVYLVDYGLAYRYTVDGVHKEYKEDPRKAHEGTIEFTSRDAHKGVAPSRRADLEILGYCMLQWLCGKLPWEDRLSDPRYVADSKERLTGNPQLLIAACLSGSARPPSLDCMCKYIEKVNTLKYDSKPDYKSFRDLLRAAGQKAGLRDEWKLDLSQPKASKRKSGEGGTPHQAKKRKSSGSSPVKSPRRKPPAAKSPAKKPPAAKSPAKKKRPAKSPAKSPAKKPPPAKSPKKKNSPQRSQTKSPAKSPAAKASTSISPRAVKPSVKKPLGKAAVKKRKSPIALPVPSKPAACTPTSNGSAVAVPRKKIFNMPAVTNSASPKASTSSEKKTVRRVRRVAAVRSDMSIQTSPGLLNNR